ncbi:hypothetical protein K402DRAFT_397557 [Aulographum hederae CBS 113979]|uniref:Uncharacterized protein n=1 Tax=Aulographum hederae CBS 113979 TaxID=1176131 RepID=A0A6G1GNG3_9PEZI|nr:hypothetical protein K402DRAFT_397557 [Aulographum hederae CBS 113979]
MSTSNPAPGVGGTAKDGGLSTADTVADGGPSDQNLDSGEYVPEGEAKAGAPSSNTRSKAKTSNPAPGVGGTAQDGGLSTAATVEDGGPDAAEPDSTYKQ